jgi:plastocyanin
MSDTRCTRRGFLTATTGAALISGATAPAAAQQTGTETTGDATGTPTDQDGTTTPGTTTGETAAGETPAGGTTHTVDMTDGLVFDPDSLTIAPGDTVVWENVGSVGHSVTAYEENIPSEAEYFASGGFESEEAARSAYPEGDIPGGESFQHTFEVTGPYEYFCIPHEGAGMIASLEVVEGGGGGGEGAAVGPPPVPESARTLGVAMTVLMVAILSMGYFFIKYGGDYGDVE